MDLEEIGLILSTERRAAGLTQEHLSDISGVPRTRISQIESGDLREIGITKIMALFQGLDLELVPRPAGLPPQLNEIIGEQEDGRAPTRYGQKSIEQRNSTHRRSQRRAPEQPTGGVAPDPGDEPGDEIDNGCAPPGMTP